MHYINRLYFVKADIANCFDNIDQQTLLNTLKDALSSVSELGQIE